MAGKTDDIEDGSTGGIPHGNHCCFMDDFPDRNRYENSRQTMNNKNILQ